MTSPDYASLWRDAMKRAGQLHPDRKHSVSTPTEGAHHPRA